MTRSAAGSGRVRRPVRCAVHLLVVAALAISTTACLTFDDRDDYGGGHAHRGGGSGAASRAARDLPEEHRGVVREREREREEKERDSRRDDGERDRDRDRDQDRGPRAGLFLEGGDEEEDDEPDEAFSEPRDAREHGTRVGGASSGDDSDYDGPWEVRAALGAAIFDDPEFGVGPALELELSSRVAGPLRFGVLCGWSGASHEQTGALARGTFDATTLLLTAGLEIPLGHGRRDPVLSVGGGAGGLFVDPDPAETLKDDLATLGLKIREDNFCLFDTRLRADLMIPLDRDRTGFLALGVVRDHAVGDVRSELRDLWTGEKLSVSEEEMTFSRTAILVSVLWRF